jgi:hypothetical protein
MADQNGVAPPLEQMTETVTPRNPAQESGVAQVKLDYEPRFKQIVQDSHASTPEARVRLAENVQKQTEDTQDFHPNAQMQAGKMFISLLQGKVGEAYKWYNGGGVSQNEARDINGNLYYKETNERGFNGRILDRHGKALSESQMKELEARGGVFTDTDQKALKTLPWINGQTNATLINNGLANQFGTVVNNAYNAARIADTSNRNIDEQIGLIKKNPALYNRIASLPAEQRARLFGLTQSYLTSGTTSSTSAENKGSANTGTQNTQTNSANVGGKLGANNGNGEGIAPPGVGGGISAGAGSSNTAGNTGGVNVSQGNAQTAGASNTNQVQANQRALIEKEIQSIIGSPEDFKDFMRVQSLNAQNEANMKSIPLSALPPGAIDLAQIDPSITGPEKILATLVAQKHNNALLAARNELLYKAAREQVKTGKTVDVKELDDQFVNSDIYKALTNKFNHTTQKAINPNYSPAINEGDLWADDANNVYVYKNGKLERKK